MMGLKVLVSILISLAVSIGFVQAQTTNPTYRYLDRKIRNWISEGYYDGAGLCVVVAGETKFREFYGGYSDTTTLQVASAGKWVVAATIAALVDRGLLDWQDPVHKFLPEFRDTKGDATLMQLLSHTSGFPDYQPDGRRRDDYQSLSESVAQIVDLPADTLPGAKFHYGGLSMQVAGRMAEVATGQEWEELFQQYIAKPLGMRYSSFIPVSEEPGFNPMLGGGFKTNVHDYMRFLDMVIHDGMFEGKQVLSKVSVEMIESDQLRGALVEQPQYVLNARQADHTDIYGLGVWREELDEFGRATMVSSPGWAGCYPWIDRRHNAYGFMLAKVRSKAFTDGFSAFYGSAVLPLLVRDAIERESYPHEMKKRFVDIGPAELYYEELGKGDPVILLHGHSLNHKMWDGQFFELAKSHRVIRYDMRGYGYSSPQREGEQFTHVEDLVRLMDTLNIEQAHIIGLSLGGFVGADMLGWFPERVFSAILASGNVRALPKPSIPMDSLEIAKRNEEIIVLKKKGIDAMKREWFLDLMRSSGSDRLSMRFPLWSMIYQWDAWQPFHREARVIAGGDAFDRLKVERPKIPVLIVEGGAKRNVYNRCPELLSHLPNGKLIIVENAGHLVNMEQPEMFNRVVFDFYNGYPSSK